jgi:hypothetical protein
MFFSQLRIILSDKILHMFRQKITCKTATLPIKNRTERTQFDLRGDLGGGWKNDNIESDESSYRYGIAR